MSLSNIEGDGFKAIDINALDSFDDEISHRTDESLPDFDRFKALFEKSEVKETLVFETLHPNPRDESGDVFEALIQETEEAVAEISNEGEDPPEPDEQEAQEEDPEVLKAQMEAEIREAAFAQGFEKGRQEGLTKGYEEGFAKGEVEGKEQGQVQGIETGTTQGFAKGEEDGFAAGEAKAKEDAKSRLTVLTDSLSAVNKVLDDLVSVHEKELLSLVFKVTEKVIQTHVDTHDEIVKYTILDALKNMAHPEDIKLSVNPDDYEYIEMVKGEFFETISSLEHISVQADSFVDRGGCKIETATASVSTDPKTKLAAIREAILKE